MGDEVVDRGVTKNGVRGNVLLWGGGTWAGVKRILTYIHTNVRSCSIGSQDDPSSLNQSGELLALWSMHIIQY